MTTSRLIAVAWCLLVGLPLLVSAWRRHDTLAWTVAYLVLGSAVVALGVLLLLGILS